VLARPPPPPPPPSPSSAARSPPTTRPTSSGGSAPASRTPRARPSAYPSLPSPLSNLALLTLTPRCSIPCPPSPSPSPSPSRSPQGEGQVAARGHPEARQVQEHCHPQAPARHRRVVRSRQARARRPLLLVRGSAQDGRAEQLFCLEQARALLARRCPGSCARPTLRLSSQRLHFLLLSLVCFGCNEMFLISLIVSIRFWNLDHGR